MHAWLHMNDAGTHANLGCCNCIRVMQVQLLWGPREAASSHQAY